MDDVTFDLEIHVGGCFVEEPTIQYVGGSVRLLTEIDPDKLSYFEIRDLCHLVGAPKEHSRYKYLIPNGDLQHDLRDIETDTDVVNMTNLHKAWYAEKIIIYTDIDVEPLAVEYPDAGEVADGGVGGDGGGVADGVGGHAGTLMGAHSELWPPRCFSQNPSLVHRSPGDRKSTRLNSSHRIASRMPSSA